MNIPQLRLQNQHLVNANVETPEEVVSHFGAMQAQDYAMVKWSIGLRMNNATNVQIEQDFNEGKFIRTHVMRPTWHFIMPEDLLWMQKLTSSRVKILMGHYNKKLGLDNEVLAKTSKHICMALKNHMYLTRQELKIVLDDIGIKTDVQKLAHILMWAELDGLICSGPRRGKQFTYALVEERIRSHKHLSHEESLATLVLKYVQSHGPVQIKDFSWWSGLTMKESQEGFAMLASRLHSEIINDKTYYSLSSLITHHTHLITRFFSIYDEYTIAYKDRTDMSNKRDIERMISMGNALTNVCVIDGIVTGSWKREVKKNSVHIMMNMFRTLTDTELQSLHKEAERYKNFLGCESYTLRI